MHIFVGTFWALVGLVMLITGSASINGDWIVLSGRPARICGATTIVLGLVVMSGNVLLDAVRLFVERFLTREIALGAFFVFFVMVTVLFVTTATVRLVKWARAER